MRTAPSSPAVAMRACPGCHAIALMAPSCTLRRRIGCPSLARRTSTTPAAVATASSAAPLPHAIARGNSPTSTRQPFAFAVGSAVPVGGAIRGALGRCWAGMRTSDGRVPRPSARSIACRSMFSSCSSGRLP